MGVQISTSFEGLVVGLSAILDSIGKTDRFRTVTVEQKGIGTELNRPLEQSLEMKWRFVEDIRTGLAGEADMTRFDEDITDAWRELLENHAAKPWTGSFDGMMRTARRMGIEAELAKAA